MKLVGTPPPKWWGTEWAGQTRIRTANLEYLHIIATLNIVEL